IIPPGVPILIPRRFFAALSFVPFENSILDVPRYACGEISKCASLSLQNSLREIRMHNGVNEKIK
ncbi:hypothetical protein KAJ27_16675, partial [bacterium]|nr:hypothetical protein [bacterium]